MNPSQRQRCADDAGRFSKPPPTEIADVQAGPSPSCGSRACGEWFTGPGGLVPRVTAGAGQQHRASPATTALGYDLAGLQAAFAVIGL